MTFKESISTAALIIIVIFSVALFLAVIPVAVSAFVWGLLIPLWCKITIQLLVLWVWLSVIIYLSDMN